MKHILHLFIALMLGLMIGFLGGLSTPAQADNTFQAFERTAYTQVVDFSSKTVIATMSAGGFTEAFGK